ncbi:MAG: hypothetical protein ACRDNZ_02010 [Streptosporangiaceae bacterium]
MPVDTLTRRRRPPQEGGRGTGGKMFHFEDDQQSRVWDNDRSDRGPDLAGRIMAAEYNLAVQRQGAVAATPMGILSRILGQWLQERAAR